MSNSFVIFSFKVLISRLSNIFINSLNKPLEITEDKLKDYGIQTVNGVANFILAKFKDQIQANSCYSFLEEKGILVRKIGEYGLPEYLRITVGLEDENKILCDEINNFLNLNGK